MGFYLNKKVYKKKRKTAKMVLTVYHFNGSPFSRAAYWTVKALGVEHELVVVNLFQGDNKKESFLQVNPRGKVPAIKDDDFTMSESRAIGCYLCNKYGNGSTLYPGNAEDKAKVDSMLYLGEAVSDAGLAWLNPAGVMFQGQVPDESREEGFLKELKVIEEALLQNQYLAGDTMSIADIFFYVPLMMMNAMKFDWQPYPGLSAWITRMKSLPFHDEVNKEAFGFINSTYQKKLTETRGAPLPEPKKSEAPSTKPPKQKKSSVCAIL